MSEELGTERFVSINNILKKLKKEEILALEN